jgi:hypothetical protein
MKNRATTAMSATTHSKVRSAAGGRRCRFHYRIRPGRADVGLLELALGSLSEVNGDTGFELRGGMGCHVGQDGPAILHAVDKPGGEADDERGTDQGGAQRGTSLVTVFWRPPTSALSRSGTADDGDRPNGCVCWE